MNIYVVRYEDGDVEFASFYPNQKEAMKGRTKFKKQFGKIGSIERLNIGRNKSGFIKLFNKFGIKNKMNYESIIDEFEELLHKVKNRDKL